MERCQVESGDKATPNQSGCTDGGCRFSGIIYQLWYLNSLGQFSSAITNIENGASTLLPMLSEFPTNIPWCLATKANTAPLPPPPPPEIDISMPLQVWAGPLGGGDMVALLLNLGNGTQRVTATWTDIGFQDGQHVESRDLWSGEAGSWEDGSISASVGQHDCAVFRLSPSTK